MSKLNMELRFSEFSVEKNEETGELLVRGYVNEIGKYSHLLGGRKQFRERIMPGAFQKALDRGNEIHFLAEHDANRILASTRNGSLTLKEDNIGLYMEARISPTTYGKDYYTLIHDGILRNMSFGFLPVQDEWQKKNDGTYTRDVSDLKLFEVSVVTNPAYPQSTISSREIDVIEDVVPEDDKCEIEMTEEEKKAKEDMNTLKRCKEILSNVNKDEANQEILDEAKELKELSESLVKEEIVETEEEKEEVEPTEDEISEEERNLQACELLKLKRRRLELQ